jgi:tRNA(Ile)-lysidine synthase
MGNGYDCIATAHHQDDLIETFFLNLSRKTGIKGLSGIKEKSGKIIRPLLFATRQNIEKYAADFFVDFREDATNSEVVFQRNFIRHKILPLFNQLNPSFSNNMLASISNLRDAEKVYDTYLEKEIACVTKKTEDGLMIQIEKLRESSFPQLILLEVLKDFGFNPSVIEEVYQALDSDSGKQFYSASYRVVKDRENLFVLPKSEKKEQVFYIEKDDMELFEPFDLTIEKLNIEVVKIVKDSKVALLDLDEIEFPLLIRKWRQGDYFQPLGMTGFKKLSDFFIDQKIPVHEKENTWLLCSGQKIIWIMGHRIDNRFKVSESTRRVLKIELKTGYAG